MPAPRAQRRDLGIATALYDKAKSDEPVARMRTEHGIVIRQAEDVDRVTEAIWKITAAMG